MQSLNVVVALADCIRAEHLAVSLYPHFRSISIARDEEELRRCIARNRATLAVVDLELLTIEEVAALCKDFAELNIICTHRVPDEALWMQTLAAGASDCCTTGDLRGILEAAESAVKPAAASHKGKAA